MNNNNYAIFSYFKWVLNGNGLVLHWLLTNIQQVKAKAPLWNLLMFWFFGIFFTRTFFSHYILRKIYKLSIIKYKSIKYICYCIHKFINSVFILSQWEVSVLMSWPQRSKFKLSSSWVVSSAGPLCLAQCVCAYVFVYIHASLYVNTLCVMRYKSQRLNNPLLKCKSLLW